MFGNQSCHLGYCCWYSALKWTPKCVTQTHCPACAIISWLNLNLKVKQKLILQVYVFTGQQLLYFRPEVKGNVRWCSQIWWQSKWTDALQTYSCFAEFKNQKISWDISYFIYCFNVTLKWSWSLGYNYMHTQIEVILNTNGMCVYIYVCICIWDKYGI